MPGRTAGRKHHHYEQFSLGLYLLALAENDRLEYPLRVEHAEPKQSPDFMLHWRSGETTGLEVTRATAQWLQREATKADREYARRRAEAAASGRDAEPVSFLLSFSGWAGDQADKEFCCYIRAAIERKLARFHRFTPASRYDLLINDDTPVGGVNRRKVLEELNPWLRECRAKEPRLGVVSIITSLDILFDVGRQPRVFPYIDWSARQLDDRDALLEFGQRVEEAGRRAVETLAPIYSLDARHRVVKETPDGRRFEMCLGEDGEEITFRELRRG